jgi:hypothetical protein
MQRLVPRVSPRLLAPAIRGFSTPGFARWAFDHYLDIAHPAFAAAGAPRAPARRSLRAA